MICFKNNCDGHIFGNNNTYVNVQITTKCPHNCIFCVAKEQNNATLENIEKQIEVCKKEGYHSYVIEGGEPLLFIDEINDIIKQIRKQDKKAKVYIFTSLPSKIRAYKPHSSEYETYDLFENCSIIMSLLIPGKLDGCNISIGSTIPEIAVKIMGITEEEAKRRNNIIKKLAEYYSDKFRISFLLTKGLIDTKEKVEQELKNLQDFGVKNVKIGELSKSDLFVSIKDIWPELQLSDPIYSGCTTFLKDKSKEFNMNITLKRVCSLVQNEYKMTKKEKLKLIIRNYHDWIFGRKNYKVIHSDGKITNSW